MTDLSMEAPLDGVNLLAYSPQASTAGGADQPPDDVPPGTLPPNDMPQEEPDDPALPFWSIYRVRDRASGRSYVGVTKRSLEMRFALHDHAARLRPHLGGPGSLAEAIRAAHAPGESLDRAFNLCVLERVRDPDMARTAEAEWIDALGTMAPAGFNLRSGGQSLGGVCNARPVQVQREGHGTLAFSSVMDAVAWSAREPRADNRSSPDLGTVYARLSMGWTPAEALGLAPHTDRRRQRGGFLWNGVIYDTIAAVSDATRLPIATIRSRLHRARLAGCGGETDIALDRRTGTLRAACSTSRLPLPTDPDAGSLSVRGFARRAGVPAATVGHRLRQLRRTGRDVAAMPRQELVDWLREPQDRTIVLDLRVDGRVLGDRRLLARRVERLGESAIRARLRKLPGWPGSPSEADIRWAFGFGRDAPTPTGSGSRS